MSFPSRAGLLAALFLGLFSPSAPAQGCLDLKARFRGPAHFDSFFGARVAGAGDVNGDGFDDLLVGSPLSSPNNRIDSGSAFVFSGADHRLLWRFDGGKQFARLGFSVTGAGDVDGDGFDDLLAGAPKERPNGVSSAGSSFLFSGATGAQILRLDGTVAGGYFGWSVGGAGDVDGDGVPDLIVGAPRDDLGNPASPDTGRAFVFSGATGARLFSFTGPAASSVFGESVAGAGDLDGDGVPDLVVGAPGAAPNGRTGAGSVFVFSGATGAQIRRFDGRAAGDSMGCSVASAGDVDGDGVPDLVVGAGSADPSGLVDGGSAFVFSGATGSQLWRFDGPAEDAGLGAAVAGAGDLDGDQVPDLLVGAPGADGNGLHRAGTAFVFSGSTGREIGRFGGFNPGAAMGASVALAGDADGDGRPDLFVGAPNSCPDHNTPCPGSAFLLAAAPSAPTVGGGQRLARRLDGQAAGAEMGRSVSNAGDMDGDGSDDLLVGAPFADPGGLSFAGSAFVFSGATGAPLFRFDGRAAGDVFGRSVAGAGDVDGDGFGDLIVGSEWADPNGLTNAGSAFVFSGATGVLLHRFDGLAAHDLFGGSVAGAGDVDGDGFDDLVVGAPGADPGGLSLAGSATVFSGASGVPLLRFDGLAAGDTLGSSVAGAGDVDGDGFPDLIVGAPSADPGGNPNAGSAFVFSGQGGALLLRLDGQADSDLFGTSVAGAGDLDGDGLGDPLVGAPYSDPFGIGDSGSAVVFSGADGTRLFQFDGEAPGELLGSSVSGAGDLDGDGRPDVLAGAPGADPQGRIEAGSIRGFSGACGVPIFRFDGEQAGDRVGFSISGGGDADGDGRPDFLAGAPKAAPNGLADAGSAFLFTFNPILDASGEVLSFTAGGTIDYTLDFPDSDAGAGYKILMSASGTGPISRQGLAIPLAADRLFRASLHGKFPLFTSGFQGTLDAQGDASAKVGVPSGGSVIPLPLKLKGRKIALHLAAVNSNFDLASVPRTLRFTL